MQTVWIQKIVMRFAGPNQGQTSIPRIILEGAYLTAPDVQEMLGIFIYLQQSENFRQVPQLFLRYMQCTISAMYEPAQLKSS